MAKSYPPPPLAPMRGQPPAAQPKDSRRGVPPPLLAPMRGTVQAKAIGRNSGPPPPLAPMRGRPPAAQAKSSRRGVPPPPLAPMRGAGPPAQAKAAGSNTVPPSPLAPFPGQAQTAQSRLAIQRKPRQARVEWMVTHLVWERKGSLFGDNWEESEVPGGELTHGQEVVVDDEDVFMSRRGANQEQEKRRKEDMSGESTNKWLGVRKVGNAPVKEGIYIRAETIKFTEKQKSIRIDVAVDPSPQADVILFSNLDKINDAWKKSARNRRRSIGQKVGTLGSIGEYNDQLDEFAEDYTPLTSGWNWDPYDEGINVSGDMLDQDDRTPINHATKTQKQWVVRAFYEGENEPIAYLILEKRSDKGGPSYLYVRWLIGHPDKAGGGSKVMEKAIAIFNQQRSEKDGAQILLVESAKSAVEWYQNKGFRIIKDTKVEKNLGYSDTTLQYGQ